MFLRFEVTSVMNALVCVNPRLALLPKRGVVWKRVRCSTGGHANQDSAHEEPLPSIFSSTGAQAVTQFSNLPNIEIFAESVVEESRRPEVTSISGNR